MRLPIQCLVVKQRMLCPKHRLGPWRDACPCSLSEVHTILGGLAEGQGGVASRPGSREDNITV